MNLLVPFPMVRRAARGALCLVFFAAVSVTANAALTWETRVVNLGVQGVAQEPGTLVARFPFNNAGTSAVEILSLQPACSCTVAELPKRHYEPGESGEIVLRFEVGERTGPQEKLLTVETSDDDPNAGPVVLRLLAEIPEAVRLRPSFVFWTQGEAVSTKTLGLVAPAGNLDAVRVESSTSDVTVEPRMIERGQRWELAVQPLAGTSRSLIATLSVICRFTPPAGGPPFERTFKAYAAVKPAPPMRAQQ